MGEWLGDVLPLIEASGQANAQSATMAAAGGDPMLVDGANAANAGQFVTMQQNAEQYAAMRLEIDTLSTRMTTGLDQLFGQLRELRATRTADFAAAGQSGNGGVAHAPTQQTSEAAAAAAAANAALAAAAAAALRERSPVTEGTHAHATTVPHATGKLRKPPVLGADMAGDPRALKVYINEVCKGCEDIWDLLEKFEWDITPQRMWLSEWLGGEERPASETRTLADLKQAFLQRFAGQVRSDRVVALERLIGGEITQGSGSVAEYVERFEAARRMLPEESPESMCKHFVRGLSAEMRLRCCLTRDGHEWGSVVALAEFAMGEERRLNLARELGLGQANVADPALHRDPPSRSFPWKRQGDNNAGKRPALGATAAAAGGSNPAAKKPKFDAAEAAAENARLRAEGLEILGRDGNNPYLVPKPPSECVQAPMGKATEKLTQAQYDAMMPSGLRPADKCRFYNVTPKTAGLDSRVVNEVLRAWWICTFCKQHRHPLSVCDNWINRPERKGPSSSRA